MDTRFLCEALPLRRLSAFEHDRALSVRGEAAGSFSGHKCDTHTWNVASEITTAPVTRREILLLALLLSKEFGFLDLLENGTFWPTLEWMDTCFGYLPRLTALDCLFS